uniref:Uncharacterized protein n=1 Tax=Glossina palpalis gambiensis TaxID=67801 RepID=A0A1B0BYT6_9MUSC
MGEGVLGLKQQEAITIFGFREDVLTITISAADLKRICLKKFKNSIFNIDLWNASRVIMVLGPPVLSAPDNSWYLSVVQQSVKTLKQRFGNSTLKAKPAMPLIIQKSKE